MDYLYDPFHRRHYRNPSPFFQPAPGFSQRPHRAADLQPNMSRGRGSFSIPVVDGNQSRFPQPVRVPRATLKAKPSEDGAAVRIQRAFRGHLVRRAVAAVRALDAEVGDIEARVRESIGRNATDEKERLRFGEMVMRVLLRLDGVRGVREYRKKVVKRAVKLQEMIDSLAAGGAGKEVGPEEDLENAKQRGGGIDRDEDKSYESLAEVLAVRERDARDSSQSGCSLAADSGTGGCTETGTESIKEAEVIQEVVKDIKNDPRPMDHAFQGVDAGESAGGIVVYPSTDDEPVTKLDIVEETVADTVIVDNHPVEEEEEPSTKPDAMETALSGDRDDNLMEEASTVENRDGNNEPSVTIEASVESSPEQEDQTFSDYVVVGSDDSTLTNEAKENTAPSREESYGPATLETAPSTLCCPKPAERPVPATPAPVEAAAGPLTWENERLRGMVEELLDRSALQCRLVCELTRRVESLEKKVDKMGKKKRKHAGDAAAAGKKN